MSDKKKKLKPVIWDEKTGLTSKYRIRMVKMIQPRCGTCRVNGPGWWDNCPHDAYHSMQAIEAPTSGFTRQQDGTYTEDTSKAQVIKGYRRVPNILQVPLTLRISSGLEVEAKLAQGCKFPQDVQPDDENFEGYAPMCEFENCYDANPKVRTNHSSLSENRMIPSERQVAHYCSDRHARLARQKDSENLVREVFDNTKRREQLEAVVL